MKAKLLSLFLLCLPLSAIAGRFTDALLEEHKTATYNDVMAGKSCQEDQNQSLSCSYKVGKSLHIAIGGIGQPDIDRQEGFVLLYRRDWQLS